MIIGAEVALFLIGIYSLITGTILSGGGKYVVQGWRARVIGVIGLLPIPLSLVITTAVAAVFIAQGRKVTHESFIWVGTGIEGSTVAVCIVAMFLLIRLWRTSVEASHLPNSARHFGAPLPTILEAIEGVFRELGAKRIKWSSDRRRVCGRLGTSFWSWGEELTVAVAESGEVRVYSVCSFPFQVVDWGKNAENRRKFLEHLTGRLPA